MRRIKTDLIKKGLGVDRNADMRGYEEMQTAKWRPEFDQSGFDDYIEGQWQLLANRLTMAFGKNLTNKPKILANALFICKESLPTSLAEKWLDKWFSTTKDFIEESEDETSSEF